MLNFENIKRKIYADLATILSPHMVEEVANEINVALEVALQMLSPDVKEMYALHELFETTIPKLSRMHLATCDKEMTAFQNELSAYLRLFEISVRGHKKEFDKALAEMVAELGEGNDHDDALQSLSYGIRKIILRYGKYKNTNIDFANFYDDMETIYNKHLNNQAQVGRVTRDLTGSIRTLMHKLTLLNQYRAQLIAIVDQKAQLIIDQYRDRYLRQELAVRRKPNIFNFSTIKLSDLENIKQSLLDLIEHACKEWAAHTTIEVDSALVLTAVTAYYCTQLARPVPPHCVPFTTLVNRMLDLNLFSLWEVNIEALPVENENHKNSALVIQRFMRNTPESVVQAFLEHKSEATFNDVAFAKDKRVHDFSLTKEHRHLLATPIILSNAAIVAKMLVADSAEKIVSERRSPRK